MSAQRARAKTADTMIGRKIGHYAITRRIGWQGGMGVVYEAVHDEDQAARRHQGAANEMSQDEKVVQRFSTRPTPSAWRSTRAS